MPVIESKGLFRGKRLRRLTPLAHLLWPFVFSLASEVYARLELDYELLAEDLRRFDEYVPNEEAMEDLIRQYAKADLCFVYEVDGVEWAQFDKPNDLRRMFPTAEEAASTEPPEPAFSEWLEKVHGKEWQNWQGSWGW
jgi:hypothetical protein